jgi:SAM-dependent methyltransferase
MATVSSRTLDVALDWKASDYYDKAESDAWTDVFWKSGTQFRRLFEKLDTTSTVELACGHGRHSARLLNAKRDRTALRSLVLLDVVEENVLHCQERFSHLSEVTVHTNSGYDFYPVEDGSVSAIFCFDAMVHFEHDAVLSYLQDAFRVLRHGGRALFHHSNLDRYPGSDYKNNPHWRNFMSKNLFAHAANRSGLRVLEQVTMNWDEVSNLDCLTLVEKPLDGSFVVEMPRAPGADGRLHHFKHKLKSLLGRSQAQR